MKVIPLSNEINVNPYARMLREGGLLAVNEGNKQNENSGQTPEQDTAEISDAAKSLFEKAPELDFKLESQIKLSKPVARNIQMQIELMQEMKRAGLNSFSDTSSEVSNFEKLAQAYDIVQKRLNENSENSNKHGKFLDDAFEAVLTSMQTDDGIKLSRSINGYPASVAILDNKDPYIESAKNHAKIFSDTFLKDYKKNGIAAVDTALAKLNDMPETSSIFNMSYKDFKHLFDNRQTVYINGN
jgi:hypothetical protein